MQIDKETLQDILNIASGLFAPLDGFMDSKDYFSVVNDMRLSNGVVWTIPITLDIEKIVTDEKIELFFEGRRVAVVEVEDVFRVKGHDIKKIFGTEDPNHPGVKKELARGPYRVGGKVVVDGAFWEEVREDVLDPKKTRAFFKKRGWRSVAGFQTRNVPHRAHEYLHRLALEFCDGLFINPLVGWKKVGDFSQEAVNVGYKALIENYYDGLNIYYDTLKTPMRYAGPREAIFHAIIRKNLGCTHFIIGRDHAGVGGYYGKYAAQELARELQKDLDIEILLFQEPFYCTKCEQMVSERCCAHESKVAISGTKIRNMLQSGQIPPKELMRPEVAQAILALGEAMFIRE